MRPVGYVYPLGREILMLDGDGWQIRIDPDKKGIKSRWFQHERWFHDKNPFMAHVPSCWQSWGRVFEHYSGTMWYQKKFTIKSPASNSESIRDCYQHAFLDFTASDFETEVWINDQRVGINRGGYSRFYFDIINKLVWGDNYLTVRVFDYWNNSNVPAGKQGGGWYTQVSGIWGSVYLELIKTDITVQDIQIVTKPKDALRNASPTKETESTWDFTISTQIKNHLSIAKPATLTISVYKLPSQSIIIENQTDLNSIHKDNDQNPIITDTIEVNSFNGKKNVSRTYQVENPALWNPTQPNLYGIKMEVKSGESTDIVNTEFGFRTIERKNSLIYLNGQPIIVRGVLDQAFHPDTLYNYPLTNNTPDAFIRKEIALLKEMGLNLTRKHIKIEDPRYLYWCDHLGMLYWEEMPNYIMPNGLGISTFKNELKRMVLRDRNHPSLIIWGIFNEEWGIMFSWFGIWGWLIRKCYTILKSLDATRLVVDNSGWAHHHKLTDINDYHDYYSAPNSEKLLSQKIASNLMHPERNFRTTASTEDVKALPIIISELGCGGLPNLENVKIPTNLPSDFGRGEYERLEEKDPGWFAHGTDNPAQGKVFAGGAHARFERSMLPRIFDRRDEVEIQDQLKEFLNIKYHIEEIRLRKSKDKRQTAGYVATEFTDIEWEYNGFLDYYRNKKVFHEDLKKINADCIVIIRLNAHNFDSGKIRANVFVSNYGYYPQGENKNSDAAFFDGKLRIEIPEILPPQEFQVKIPVNDTIKVKKFEFDIDSADKSVISLMQKKGCVKSQIKVLLTDGNGEKINENFEPLFLWDKAQTQENPLEYAKKNDIIISAMIKREDIRLAKEGKKVIVFFNDFGYKKIVSANKRFWNLKGQIKLGMYNVIFGRMILKLGIFVKLHPFGENWVGMFSFHFTDKQLYLPLENQRSMGWESEHLFPNYKMKVETRLFPRIKKETGSVPKYEFLAGIMQGWYNAVYGTVVKIRYGKGIIMLCLLPLLKEIEMPRPNPTAVIMFKNLIQNMKDS